MSVATTSVPSPVSAAAPTPDELRNARRAAQLTGDWAEVKALQTRVTLSMGEAADRRQAEADLKARAHRDMILSVTRGER